MSIKQLIKSAVDKITDNFNIKNIILFESVPAYSDNTKAVFDEMIKREFNNSYQLIWVCEKKEEVKDLNEYFKETKNVKCVGVSDFVYKFYYRKTAKAFIVCNLFLLKAKPEQYYCDLAHGCALKNAAGTYSLPKSCKDADVMTISNYMAPYDAHNLMCDVKCMKPLGYARNDDLFKQINVHKYFNNISFDKVIYWLPTYRQNRWGDRVHSDISMPIIYSRENAERVNEEAKRNNVLIIVKVHPAQDLSKISEFNLSNLVFIKNDFFSGKDITNYQLLGSSDAMLSDYSSVYYDYLLTDKPIGLCFDDFEEYSKREGFTMNVDEILAGGEKLYNVDDLCNFIKSVAEGEDRLKDKRNEIKNLVHDRIDNQSSVRITDYLENKISNL